VPICALFVGVGDPEHRGFVQFLAKNLETNRELISFFFQETARHADPTDPGDVRCQSKDVREIHTQGIVCTLTQFECRCRRGGADNRIDLLEGSREILPDQGSNFLGPQIISVVIARTQNVGAKDNAPLDLRTEPLLSGFAVMIQQALRVLGPETVSHSVEPGEVRRCLAGAIM
jgi:hypothetical protein